MKLVTFAQMRSLEQRADTSGNSYPQMMERAGTLTAQALIERKNVVDEQVLVLVGPGNNGGDGLVCARALSDAGAVVVLYIWKRDFEAPDENMEACRARGLPIVRAEEDAGFTQLRQIASACDIIVDALLGTGVARPITGTLADLLEVVREALDTPTPQGPLSNALVPSTDQVRAFVLAVDLPSGLSPDTGALDPATVAADLTVTFAFPKLGQVLSPGADAVGELVVADIGIPAAWASSTSVELATANEIAARLPERTLTSNKGTYGKVMLAVGSRNYIGAATLAGTSAGRVGAGLVTLALPESVYPLVASHMIETTYLPLPEAGGAFGEASLTPLLDHLQGYDALLVGCGLGRAPETAAFVKGLRNKDLPPLVLDADALNILAELDSWWQGFKTPVLTPHPGEMARLAGLTIETVQKDRIGVARDCAARWQSVVVLKGAHTVVAAPDGQLTVLPFANPALATAGTGDVLAGAIAGFLAQRVAPYAAALLGAFVHGAAGEIVRREIGPAGAVAGDLLTRLPQALRDVRGQPRPAWL